MSACLNPNQRHSYLGSESGRRVCPEPRCGFLLEGAWIGSWRITSLCKHNPLVDLYAATPIGEQGSRQISMFVRVLRHTDVMLLPHIKILQNLHHPHIHPLIAVEEVESGGPLCLLSRFEARGSLATYLATNAHMSFSTVAAIVGQIAQALQQAHAQRLVHGHLKPENYLLSAPGVVQVCDFYTALLEDAPGNHPTLFTAPEQMQARTLPASDQFALAAFAYLVLKQRSSLVLGRAADWSEGTYGSSLLASPEPLLSPTHPLDQLLRRALSTEPAERFPDIQAFVLPFCAMLERMVEPQVPPSPSRNSFPTRISGTLSTTSLTQVGRNLSGMRRFAASQYQDQKRFAAQMHQNVVQGQLPSGVIQTSLLPGHTAVISSLCWASNGHMLASGSEDGEIRLWAFQGHIGQLANLLQGHQGRVRALCWSPDGTALASASSDSAIRIWNIVTGTSKQAAHSWWGHDGETAALGWSPDGTLLASGGKDGTMCFWSYQGDLLVRQHAHGGKGVKSLAWSADQQWLATGGADRLIRIWSATTKRQEASWGAHLDEILLLKWSPNGHFLASAAGKKDTCIYLWDVRTKQCIATITGHRQEIVGLSWAHDSSWLVTCSIDGSLRFWLTNQLLEKRSVLELCTPIVLEHKPQIMVGALESRMLAIATRSLSIAMFSINSNSRK